MINVGENADVSNIARVLLEDGKLSRSYGGHFDCKASDPSPYCEGH